MMQTTVKTYIISKYLSHLALYVASLSNQVIPVSFCSLTRCDIFVQYNQRAKEAVNPIAMSTQCEEN